MSMEATPTPTIDLDLTTTQQWVIHHALLEYAEVANAEDTDLPEPTVELTILEKLEAGILTFTGCELERVRHICERHAASEHTPVRDHTPARTVAQKIDRLSFAEDH